MKRVLVAAVVLLLMLGLVFTMSPATHNVALGSSTTHVLVADANDGSGNSTNGGYSGGDSGTNGGYSGGDSNPSTNNSNTAPTPTP